MVLKRKIWKFSCKWIAIITFLTIIAIIFTVILHVYYVNLQNQKRPTFEIIEHNTIFLPGAVPFEQCHASTLCKLQDGALICAWYGGSMEGASDVAIWVSRKEGGKLLDKTF